jgi:hypothetical protein
VPKSIFGPRGRIRDELAVSIRTPREVIQPLSRAQPGGQPAPGLGVQFGVSVSRELLSRHIEVRGHVGLTKLAATVTYKRN